VTVGQVVSCSDLVDFVVTGVALVDAPDCSTDEALLQGGFEPFTDSMLVSPWLPTSVANGSSPASSVELVQSSSSALTGAGALRLQTPFMCQRASVLNSVVVPVPTGNAGPALSFAYRFPATGVAGPEAEVCVGGDCQRLAATDPWTADTLCIDPILAGRQLSLVLRLFGGHGLCSTQYGSDVALWFDDVQLVLASGCPAQ
jgi:hypothetical protein